MGALLIYMAIIGGFSALIWLNDGLVVALALWVAAAVGLIINRRDTTRITDRGSDLRDATAGFRRCCPPASSERFDYAARVRHFDEYLPWAVAFDCAEEWAASCTPPPGSPEASALAGTSHLYSSPTNTSRMWALSTRWSRWRHRLWPPTRRPSAPRPPAVVVAAAVAPGGGGGVRGERGAWWQPLDFSTSVGDRYIRWRPTAGLSPTPYVSPTPVPNSNACSPRPDGQPVDAGFNG